MQEIRSGWVRCVIIHYLYGTNQITGKLSFSPLVPGSDQVHHQTPWEAKEEIVEALADVFASSLATGVDP